MPRLIHAPPKYRKHKASGQAVVTINGRDHYLGPSAARPAVENTIGSSASGLLAIVSRS
jgi:hypothetical protein